MAPLANPSPADDLFLHQIVGPQGQVGTEQRWGERSFFSVPLDEGALLELGLRAYPQRGTIEGYAVARDADVQRNVRAARNLQLDNPLTLTAGVIHSEVVRPQREWKLAVAAPAQGIEAELTYRSRTVPFYTEPLKVERDGELLVHNLTYFQSGRYTGQVRVGDREFELKDSVGARDRSWGHRKRESAPARGLMSWIDIELADGAVIVWLYEKADGTRTYTDGCWLDEDGNSRRVESVEHRYEFDPESGALCGGTLIVDGRAVSIEVGNVVYMAGAGHVEGTGRSGSLTHGEVRGESWSLAHPAACAERRSVDDHLVAFELDGTPGRGIIEVARGTHVRYGDPPPRGG